jgi:hypothetical protein
MWPGEVTGDRLLTGGPPTQWVKEPVVRRVRRSVHGAGAGRRSRWRGWVERVAVGKVLASRRASMAVISVVAKIDPMQRWGPPLKGMNSCGAGLR